MIVSVSLNGSLALPSTDPVTVNRALLVLLGTPQVAITLESADLPTGGVTEAKIANEAVTKLKLAADQRLHSGFVMAYAGGTAPDGWLLCDGSAVSRTTYASLYAAIGTTHGSGDGSTTFNLPNLADKFVIGKSGTRTLGATGGSETVDSSHTHTLPAATGSTTLTGAQSGVAAHFHTWNVNDTNASGSPHGTTSGPSSTGPGTFNTIAATTVYRKTSLADAANAAEGHTHTITGPTGSGGSTTLTIVPPYVALAYLIKT